MTCISMILLLVTVEAVSSELMNIILQDWVRAVEA